MARGYNGSTSNYHLGTNAPVGRYPATLIGRYKKSSDVVTEQCMLSVGVSGGSAKLICVEIFSSGILALAGDGSTFTGATKAGALADSAWHSFCAVFRDLAWRIAGHDGVFGTAETTSRDWLTGSPTMNRVTVGALYWSPTSGAVNPFNGDLAECAFMQTALAEEEYLAWHNGTHGGRAYTLQDMRPGTTRAYYPLNDGTGNEANYCSMYGNTNYDLTEQGTVTQTTHPTVATFAHDGVYRPLLSNQRVWTNGITEAILSGAHTWMGVVQHAYLTRQSVSDNFDIGVTPTSLRSTWTAAVSSHSIIADSVQPAAFGEAVSRWTSATYVDGADQFAVITVASLTGATSVMGPIIRADATAANMYWLSAPAGVGATMTLYKRVASVDTSLGTSTWTAASNDKLYLEARGTAIKAYLNGVLKISATDSAIAGTASTDRPGFRTSWQSGDANIIGAWRAGNLSSSTAFYPQDYTTELDALQTYGHNYTRAWGWDFMRSAVFSSDTLNGPLPWGRSGTAGAYDGGNKFDLTTLDSDYFTRLVAFVDAARARNIVVSVVLWELSLGKSNTLGHPFTSTNNINSITGESGGTMAPVYTTATAAITTAQDLYLDHLLDLLGGYWNVQYETGNEPVSGTTNINGTTSGCDQWLDRMTAHIRAYEFANCTFQHMIVACSSLGADAVTLQSRSSDATAGASSWTGYTASPLWTIAEYAPALGVGIYDGDHFNDSSSTFTADVFWRALCQGFGGLLNMEDGFYFGEVSSGSWYGINVPIRSNMGYIRNMTRRMTLATARPSSALASTGFCLSTPGTEYLVYQPGSAAFTVNLSSASGVPFTARWLNTNDGAESVAAVTGGSAVQSMTPPFGGSPSGIVLLLTVARRFLLKR